MTTIEACKIVRDRIPDAKHITATKHHCQSFQLGEYDSYDLSLQPGRNGTSCEQTHGDSLEACLALMFPDFTVTPNIE